MKRYLYQLFMVRHGRVELFFLLSAVSAFLFYPHWFMGALCSFFLPYFFIRRRVGVAVGLVVLCLFIFSSTALLVTGTKQTGGEKNVYATASGTLVTKSALAPGDVVYAGHKSQKYAGEPEGRFARGYFIAEDVSSIRVPLLGALLTKRQELSDKMFDSTGGALRLTQAIVMGDKQYLEYSTTDKYMLTGLGHLLAISGLHVGLYAMVCFMLFGFLPYKLRLIPAGLMLMLLIPFAGFKIPVLRAGLIGLCIVSAKFLDYSADMRKMLLFFAGLFMLISPAMVVSPSFILSFSAVYGLLHLSEMRFHRSLTPVMVGLVATAFITPASAAFFGTFNVSSVITTILLIPVLSLQVVSFLIYMIFPAVSTAPLILLERMHLGLIDYFADWFGAFFTLYKSGLVWAFAMMFFLYACMRFRAYWLALLLILVPYAPTHVEDGAYFPNMGRSKGFVVVDDSVHVYFRGMHSDYLYGFIPYLAEVGVRSADYGRVEVYGSENIFIPIAEQSDNYGWLCVNEADGECLGVYHTRSGTFDCKDGLIHILYKNGCRTEETYLLSETGDLKIENPSE